MNCDTQTLSDDVKKLEQNLPVLTDKILPFIDVMQQNQKVESQFRQEMLQFKQEMLEFRHEMTAFRVNTEAFQNDTNAELRKIARAFENLSGNYHRIGVDLDEAFVCIEKLEENRPVA